MLEKPNKNNKEISESTIEQKAAKEEEFQTQRGGGRGRNYKKVVSHWNAIRGNRVMGVINIENKFRALEDKGNDNREIENKDNKGNQKATEVTNIKEWVLEKFKGQQKEYNTGKEDRVGRKEDERGTSCSKADSHSDAGVDGIADKADDSLIKETTSTSVEEIILETKTTGEGEHSSMDKQPLLLLSNPKGNLEQEAQKEYCSTQCK